jgi:hypothetical protein
MAPDVQPTSPTPSPIFIFVKKNCFKNPKMHLLQNRECFESLKILFRITELSNLI